MRRSKFWHPFLCLGLIVLAIEFPFPQSPAQAETYIAGQFGWTIQQKFRNFELTSGGTSLLNLSDPLVSDLENSFLVGGKVGHYFRSLRWLGFEMELHRTSPDIKERNLLVTGPLPPPTPFFVPETDLTIITWAPMNILLRYPGRRLQPYIGVGPGLFFAKRSRKDVDDSQSSNWRIGLNAQAGIRFYLARHWALFAEAKYHQVKLKFEETPVFLDGFNAKYQAIHGVVGFGYHF